MTAEPSAATAVTTTRVEWAPVPRVNLLPQEIIDSRRFRRTQQYLALGVVGCVVVCGAAVLWASQDVARAQDELAAVQAETAILQLEQAKYADVPRVLAQVEGAKLAREQAMSSDVAWYRYLNDIALSIPSTVWLSNISVSVTATSSTSTLPSANPLAPTGIGDVTFEGGAIRYPDVATWLESLDKVKGFDGVSLGDTTIDEASARARGTKDGPVKFANKVVVTEDALSHRFDRKAG